MIANSFEVQETVHVHESIDRVWDVLVIQNGLKRWLHAQLFVLEIADNGLIEVPFFRDETSIDVVGETSYLNPPHQLMFTWIEQDPYGREWAFPTVVSLAFVSHNGGTRVTLTHKGFQRLPLETREKILAQYKNFWHEKMGKSLQETITIDQETGDILV